jgi:hypothetical protein
MLDEVVLPIPGSPAIQTSSRWPLLAWSHARCRRETASARPMNDVACRGPAGATTAGTVGIAGIAGMSGAAMKR